MRKLRPIHPLLFAVLPVFSLYSHNAGELRLVDLELPLALTVIASAVLWLLLSLIVRDLVRAALMSSLFWVWFFLFGHFYRPIASIPAAGFTIPWTLVFLIGYCTLLIAGMVALSERRRGLQQVSSGLNIVAGALVACQLLIIGGHELGARGQRAAGEPRAMHAAQAAHPARPTMRPDIYYIILDSYARADVLRDLYHCDNSEFLQHLIRRGFRVPRYSRTNYGQTTQSLASSLNFEYLDALAAKVGPGCSDRHPLVEMIQRNRLFGYLRERGYRIAVFASSCQATDLRDADTYLCPVSTLSEFENGLLNTTPLPLLLASAAPPGLDPVRAHAERIARTFRHLPDAGRGGGPVFVFAHFLCPHPPFVFDRNGIRSVLPTAVEFKEDVIQHSPSYADHYREQVLYVNREMQAAVDRIMAGASRPTVIIIQSDHGPSWHTYFDDLARTDLRERFGNLLAYYLPGAGAAPADDRMSPVNIFRVVLNRYFGEKLPPLPNETYFSSWERPYQFTRVTDEVDAGARRSARE